MITRKLTAFIAAIFLVTISNQAEARLHSSKVDQFCGDKYCGHISTEQNFKQHRTKKTYRTRHRSKEIVTHKEIRKKPVQVASLGDQPTGEAPLEHSKGLLSEAKKYLGGNPTGWRSLWCARFIAYIAPAVAERLKRMGLNPNWARDYAALPGARKFGAVGDIVVLTRGRGGHIGVLTGYKNGNPIIISGNHGRKVGTGVYSKSRVIAYVPPLV